MFSRALELAARNVPAGLTNPIKVVFSQSRGKAGSGEEWSGALSRMDMLAGVVCRKLFWFQTDLAFS